MTARLVAAAVLALSASAAAAEPATVASAVNLRSGASSGHEIVGRIPTGARIDAANCSEWCEVEWQGRKGFVIATAVDRSGRSPARRTTPKLDLSTADLVSRGDVPMSAGTYQAPERYYGPYFWGYGPSSGPYRGTSGIGYRGRW